MAIFSDQACKYYLAVFFKFILLLSTSVFSAYTPEALQQEIPVIDVMPEMDTEWVARKVLYNGIPTSIQNFTTVKPIKEVIDYYKNQWGNKAVQKTVKHVETIGTEINGFYYSVQAEAQGRGAHGSLTVTPVMNDGSLQVNNETEFPFLPDSIVITKVEAVDRGVLSETLTAINQSSATDNENWLTNELVNQGWQKLENNLVTNSQQNSPITFHKGKQICQISIIESSQDFQGATMIMVNWIKGE